MSQSIDKANSFTLISSLFIMIGVGHGVGPFIILQIQALFAGNTELLIPSCLMSIAHVLLLINLGVKSKVLFFVSNVFLMISLLTILQVYDLAFSIVFVSMLPVLFFSLYYWLKLINEKN